MNDNTEVHQDLINILKQLASSKPIILQYNGNDLAALISIEII